MLTNTIFKNIYKKIHKLFSLDFCVKNINISENNININDVKATKVLWYMVTN